MRPVSQEFKDAVAANDPVTRREVSYKRRYWNASTNEYVWESGWTVINESDVASVSPMTEQLDSEQLNEFKSSNLTISLKNFDGRWRSDNPDGVFGPDSTSPLYFYVDYWTKFRVRIGVRLQDLSYEYTSRFVGLATEFTHNSDDEMVQITVQGLESLLQNANAENVSTRVVQENAGTGNDLAQDLTTDNNGVGIIEEVSVGGVSITAGASDGYSVSNLNEPSLPATISLRDGSGTGTVRITYRYWKQAQTIEALVSDLLTEAGVSLSAQIVDPVVFPGLVLNSWNQDTQADWLSGTLSALEASTVPGDVIPDYAGETELLDDFSDGNLTSSPAWTNSGSVNVSVSSNKLLFQANPTSTFTQILSTPLDRVIGTWKASLAFDYVGFSGDTTSKMLWAFMCSGTNSSGIISGYAIKVSRRSGPFTVELVKTDSSAVETSLASYSLGNFGLGPGVPEKVYTVTRYPSGRITVDLDSTRIIDVTDSSVTSSSYEAFYQKILTNVNITPPPFNTADSLYAPPDTITGSLISASFDIGAIPSGYGKLVYDETLTGTSTGIFYTRSSADGMSWDDWVAISGTDSIQSSVKRYVQVRWIPSVDSSTSGTAVLHSFGFQYATASTTIALANFTGMTCYTAIQALGAMANYEWGFTPDEDFFFRAKDVSKVADMQLTRENGDISSISGMVSGQDRTYTQVKASYGNFESIVTAPSDTEGAAGAQFGSRVLSLDGGEILLGADSNIANGIASTISRDVFYRKRRMKLSAKFIPQLDLSDVVLVTFGSYPPSRRWFHGDTSIELGDTSLFHFGPKQQIVAEMYSKIIGVRRDYENSKVEFDLQEIL